MTNTSSSLAAYLAQTSLTQGNTTASSIPSAAALSSQSPAPAGTLIPSPIDTSGNAPLSLLWMTLLVVLIVAIVAGLLAVLFKAAPSKQSKTGEPNPYARPISWVLSLTAFTIFGFIAIPFIEGLPKGTWIEIELIAIGLFVVGAFFGFLFGLPTVVQAGASTESQQPLLAVNTHLEEVTAKIATLLTGVALAEVITIPTYIGAFNAVLSESLHVQAAGVLGIALMLYFPPVGFITSYVIMRTVGSDLFARADARLQRFAAGQSKIAGARPLPDSIDDATEDQLCAARSIAEVPYATLRDVTEKALWARANGLLEHYADAERAYQDVRVLDPRNYHALIDYATVIYNDVNIDDIPYVLSILEAAEALCPATDLNAQSRLKGLRAAALLYRSGGYEGSISVANDLIRMPNLPQPKLIRFYRACGFGQLFWALQATNQVTAEILAPIGSIIRNDAALTLAQGKLGRDQLLNVTTAGSVADNDLQAFANFDVAFQNQLGIAAPPMPQPPAPVPPQTITPAAIVADWIAKNCPP